MKKLSFIYLLFFSICVDAQQLYQPVLTASEVVNYLLIQENLKKDDVKVVIIEFDYLKNVWHIELAPAKVPCIDCYPAYYIENTRRPKIKKLMHG